MPGDAVSKAIARPNGYYKHISTNIVCTWDGTASSTISAMSEWRMSFSLRTLQIHPGLLQAQESWGAWEFVYLKSVDSQDPVRNFDCREEGSEPRTRIFDPEFLAFVSRFKTVRFMTG